MALYKNGILGAYRNKVGTVVGRIWRGKDVVAAMPKSMHNPNTDPQKKIRSRFAVIGRLAASLLNALNIGLHNVYMKRQSTAIGEFVRLNWDAVESSGATVTTDYSAIKVAKGNLVGVLFGTPDFDTPQQIVVSFESNEEADGTSLDDKVYLLVYCPDADAAILSAPVKRSARSVSLMVPSYWSGMAVHLWGFTKGDGMTNVGDNRGKISNSTYIGKGNIG